MLQVFADGSGKEWSAILIALGSANIQKPPIEIEILPRSLILHQAQPTAIENLDE